MRNFPRRECGALFALSCAAYLPCLWNGFVLDDAAYVVLNQTLRHPARWPSFFYSAYSLSADPGMSKILYRPLSGVSHALNYLIAGPSPFWFHLHDVVLHALNVGLVFLLARRLDEKGPRPWLAALVFCLHPVQAQSVAYLGARGGLLSIFFVLSALLLYDRSLFRFSWAAFAAGLLCKESTVFFVLVLPAWDFLRKTPGASWKARLRRWGPYLVLAAAFLAARTAVLGHVNQRGPWGDSWNAHFQLASHALFEYVRIALWPAHLREPYGFLMGPWFPAESVAMLAACCALFAASARGLSRRAVAGFGGFWFFAALAPVSNLVPFATLTADRLLYASMVGLSLLAAFLAPVKPAKLFWAATVSLALTLAALSLDQQIRWRSDFVLALAATAEAPREPYAALRLSAHYANWRMFSRAEALIQPALGLEAPPDVRRAGCRKLAQIRVAQGRPAEAIPLLEASLGARSTQKAALELLGRTALSVGDHERAEDAFRRAAELP